jgi:uncharacterized membrane protein YfcA
LASGVRTFTIRSVDDVSLDNRRQPRFFAVPTLLTFVALCSFAGSWTVLKLQGNAVVLLTLWIGAGVFAICGGVTAHSNPTITRTARWLCFGVAIIVGLLVILGIFAAISLAADPAD